MTAKEWLAWYNRTVWNVREDLPVGNMHIRPCDCGKKHGAHPCKGWKLVPKTAKELKAERQKEVA